MDIITYNSSSHPEPTQIKGEEIGNSLFKSTYESHVKFNVPHVWFQRLHSRIIITLEITTLLPLSSPNISATTVSIPSTGPSRPTMSLIKSYSTWNSTEICLPSVSVPFLPDYIPRFRDSSDLFYFYYNSEFISSLYHVSGVLPYPGEGPGG